MGRHNVHVKPVRFKNPDSVNRCERLLRACPKCKGTYTRFMYRFALAGVYKVVCETCMFTGEKHNSLFDAVAAWNDIIWRRKVDGDDLLICEAAREYAEVAEDVEKLWRYANEKNN